MDSIFVLFFFSKWPAGFRIELNLKPTFVIFKMAFFFMDMPHGKHKKYVKFFLEETLLTTLLIFCVSGMLNFEVDFSQVML